MSRRSMYIMKSKSKSRSPKNTKEKIYDLQSKIGKGHFGVVYKAKNNLDEAVAVKLLPLPTNEDQRKQLKKIIKKEKTIYTILKKHHLCVPSSNIVCIQHIQELVDEHSKAFIVMEMPYISAPTLQSLSTQNIRWKPEHIRSLYIQLLQVLEKIHSLDIVHRDLKPDNIFWVPRSSSTKSKSNSKWNSYNGNVKIIDWGIACITMDCQSTFHHAPKNYLHPELVSCDEKDKPILNHVKKFTTEEWKKNDVYMVTLSLLQILLGSYATRVCRIQTNTYEPVQYVFPKEPKWANDAFQSILLTKYVKNVPTAKQVLDMMQGRLSWPKPSKEIIDKMMGLDIGDVSSGDFGGY